MLAWSPSASPSRDVAVRCPCRSRNPVTSALDVLEVSTVADPSHGSSGPADERGCWLVVLPFLSRSALVVVVGGYADVHTAPELRAQLLSTLVHQREALVLDLQDLEFCDLHGLDAFDDAVEAARQAGTSVSYRGVSAQLAWLQAAFPRRPTSRRSVGPCSVPPSAVSPRSGADGPAECPPWPSDPPDLRVGAGTRGVPAGEAGRRAGSGQLLTGAGRTSGAGARGRGRERRTRSPER